MSAMNDLKSKLSESLTTMSHVVPTSFKETALLRGFALLKIPMIAFCSPRVDRLDDKGVEITIPLGYRTRNHVGSMYFGALSTGADLAMGYMVFREIQKRNLKAQFVFKAFQAEFLKRAEADVVFKFDQGAELHELMVELETSTERINRDFDIVALTPSLGEEPVAKFKLTLSIKRR